MEKVSKYIDTFSVDIDKRKKDAKILLVESWLFCKTRTSLLSNLAEKDIHSVYINLTVDFWGGAKRNKKYTDENYRVEHSIRTSIDYASKISVKGTRHSIRYEQIVKTIATILTEGTNTSSTAWY